MTRTGRWALLTALLIVALMGAGWMLVISPKHGEAAEIVERTDGQEQANAMLRMKIERLKVQAKDLPKEQAKLTRIRTQIPDNPELPSLIRNLTDAGKESGATLVSVSPGAPAPVGTGAPVAATAAPAGAPAASAGAGAVDPATSGAVGGSSAGQLVMIPVTVTASGKYFEIEQLINEIEELQRSFLVTGFTLENPAASDGGTTLNLSVSGRIFVSQPSATSDAAAAPTASTPTASTPAAASPSN